MFSIVQESIFLRLVRWIAHLATFISCNRRVRPSIKTVKLFHLFFLQTPSQDFWPLAAFWPSCIIWNAFFYKASELNNGTFSRKCWVGNGTVAVLQPESKHLIIDNRHNREDYQLARLHDLRAVVDRPWTTTESNFSWTALHQYAVCQTKINFQKPL